MHLVVTRGARQGTVIPIKVSPFRIGRDESCNLRPRSEGVSREHAELRVVDGALVLRDLGSTRGTKVNGEPLAGTVRLRNGDVIEIGPLAFEVRMKPTPKPEPEPEPEPKRRPAPAPARPRKPGEDEVAAWLVGDGEEADREETPPLATASPAGGDHRARAGRTEEPAGEDAFNLLKAMSVDRS